MVFLPGAGFPGSVVQLGAAMWEGSGAWGPGESRWGGLPPGH